MTRQPETRSASNPGAGLRLRRLPRWKKTLFSALTTLLVLGGIEGGLFLAGMQSVLTSGDPFVGFASQVPLYVEQTDSVGHAVMTTAPNKLEYFNTQRFPKRKVAGTYRIFCMGGSTTYGRPFDDTTSFAGWLRELLPRAAPNANWEVINAGGISYASYRVAALMEELTRYEPDLFIVYTGQNEFLEERTYANVRSISEFEKRLTVLLGRTRTYALLQGMIKPSGQRETDRFQFPSEVDAMLDHTVGPSSYHRDEELRRTIVKHYEINLARMVGIARSCGAGILFVKPASNLSACSPFKSQHADGLTPTELKKWNRLFQRGSSLATDGKPRAALADFESARNIDDRFAELHYRMGGVLFKLNRLAEANVAYRRAVDEDVCPLRAVSQISDILDRTAKRLNAAVVDFQTLVANDCLRNHGHNSPGEEYFLDHVHPTIAANRSLAVAIIECLIEIGIVDSDASLSEEDIGLAAERVESQIDARAHAVALRNLAKVLNWAGKHHEAGPLAMKSLETIPNDPESLFLSAAYLKMTGKIDRAIQHYRKTLEHTPDYVEAHQLLGAALVERKDFDDARKQFLEVVRLRPDDAYAYHMVGAILVEQKRFERALEYYRKSIQLKPDDADVHYNLAFALAQLGRPAEAVSSYERSIRLNPEDADARYNLGVLLMQDQRFRQAAKLFRRALEIRPDFADARNKLRVATEAATD